MNRTFFGHMVLLILVVLTAFVLSAFLMGRFDSVEKEHYRMLDIQMEVFEKDVTSMFDELAFRGVVLSEDVSELLDGYTQDHHVAFRGETNTYETIQDIQELMSEPLKEQLLQTDCSGVFIMLDITARAGEEGVGTRSGLYFQKNGIPVSCCSDDILLYRGISQVGKKHDVMPHRKWKPEFQDERLMEYAEKLSYLLASESGIYNVTEAISLPGTSEKAMFLTVPMVGRNGMFYGICGFEISERFFKHDHSQASRLPHLTCILTREQGGVLDTTIGLSSGVKDGYYLAPEDRLEYDAAAKGLVTLSGAGQRTVGLVKKISLDTEGSDHILAVMIPERDHERAVRGNVIKTIGLLLLLVTVTVICCLYLSKKYLRGAQMEKEEVQEAYRKAQTEIQRLAYSRKSEIDPDDYRYFLDGLETLTPTEKTIFGYYVEGNSVKEVMELAGIKESTLRYHNQNIYRKLGVNSMKQMLRYAALWQEEHKQERNDTKG